MMGTIPLTEATPVPCDKCRNGTMRATRIRRYPRGLVALGYALWVPALVLWLGVTSYALLVAYARADHDSQQRAEWRQEAAVDLRRVPALPEDVVDRFVREGVLDEGAIARLPARAQDDVRFTVGLYAAKVSGAQSPVAAFGFGSLLLTAICLPVCLVGWLLTRRHAVRLCPNCGYFYARHPTHRQETR